MQDIFLERRRSQRFPDHQSLSINLRNGGQEVAALSGNISSGGVFVYCDRFIAAGTHVSVIVTLPTGMSHERSVRVWCDSKVVRVESQLIEEKFGCASSKPRALMNSRTWKGAVRSPLPVRFPFMIILLRHLLGWILISFGPRKDLILENLALRGQLLALHTKRPRRRLSTVQKLFWVVLRRLWSRWQKPWILVTPRTVVEWHRAGFRLYWRWLSSARRLGGRKPVGREIRTLIFRMAAENPTWGAPRIHGELLPGENESGEGLQGYCCKEGAVRILCRPAEGSSTRTYGWKEESSLPFVLQTRRCATSPNGTRSQRSACGSIGRYPCWTKRTQSG